MLLPRRTALAHNAQVIALASEVVVPYVADRSPLAALLETAAGARPIQVGGLHGEAE